MPLCQALLQSLGLAPMTLGRAGQYDVVDNVDREAHQFPSANALQRSPHPHLQPTRSVRFLRVQLR